MKSILFNSMVSNYEIVNPEFAKVKVYVAYAGKNRNYSEIPKDTLDKMAKTIYGIPLVAEYDSQNNCFKGHGGKVEITDSGVEFLDTTVPYGFVDPSTPVFYETVTELDGMTKNDYLCCYAYLWYKRYPEVESVLKNQENKKIGQSMEIIPTDYDFTDDGYCVIKDGYFSALALLGVEPCFESAMITSKFALETTKDDYQCMIDTFRMYAMDVEKGGEDLEDIKDKFEEEVCEECGKNPCECKDDSEDMAKKKKCSKCENEVETTDEFSEGEEFVCEECAKETEEETYTKEQVEEIKSQYEKQINDLKAQYTDLTSDKVALESEIVELREYKANVEKAEFEAQEVARKSAIDEALEKYSELETIEGYSELIKNKYEVKLSELEKNIKVFAFDNGVVLGKKQGKKNFSKEVNKIPVIGNSLDDNSLTEAERRYGKGISKYINK